MIGHDSRQVAPVFLGTRVAPDFTAPAGGGEVARVAVVAKLAAGRRRPVEM